MKKGIFKRITALVMAIVMIITVMPSTVLADEESNPAVKTATKDGITVTKTASFAKNEDGTYKTVNGNPVVKIDFTVDSNVEPEKETVVAGTTDIVLVIDRSGSMKDSNKMQNAKDAANSFVENVLGYNIDENNPTVQVGLVSFAGEASSDVGLTSSVGTLTSAIGDLSADGGTFMQDGILKAKEMLSGSEATNKIIILLSDGAPTYRYSFNKQQKEETYWAHKDITCEYSYCSKRRHPDHYEEKTRLVDTNNDDRSKRTIVAPLANPTEYDAYYNFASTRTGNGSDSTKIIKDSTISQAYLAREAIEGLNIYSVGYAVGQGSDAEKVLQNIADQGKYSHADVNELDSVISAITTDVEITINGVNLVDKIPSEMTLQEGSVKKDDTLAYEVTSDGIKFTWTEALQKGQYNMSFETVLDLSKLTASQFADGVLFNTNGSTVEPNGVGANSSTLTYGTDDNAKITLDSPQLNLTAHKYEVHYFYDENDDGEYSEAEEDKEYQVDPEYRFVLPDGTASTVQVEGKDKADYELDTVNGSPLGALVVDSDKVVNVYYKKQHKKNIVITKVWNDNKDQDGIREDEVTVVVSKDGEAYRTVTLNEGNNWTATLSNLVSSSTYTVAEQAVAGYGQVEINPVTTTDDKGNITTTYTITNTHVPETVRVNVEVEWRDNSNQDGKRPASVRYELFANGKTTNKFVTLTDDKLSDSFANLPKYENGEEITYSVTQAEVPNYEKDTEHNGLDFKFINSYTPEVTSVTVEKRWLDNNNAEGNRQDVNVQLKQNGTVMEGKTATLTDANSYKATFTGLPKYVGGKLATYTVKEFTNITDYTAYYSGLVVTNKYKENDKTSVSVTKNWNDGENVDGLRKSVNVTVYATNTEDEIVDQTFTLSEANQWTHVFENLQEYDSQGKKIVYKVRENTEIEGYTTTYQGNGTNNVTITNSHTPATTSVTVNKVWVGDDNVASKVRPESVSVQLYANGSRYGKVETITGIDSVNTWSKTFTGLPKNYIKDGKTTAIEYTVEEVSSFEHYDKKAEGLTITNTYDPVMTTHTVTKEWNDNDNHDGKRPTDITVTLMNGNTKVATQELTVKNVVVDATGVNANVWQYVFENIPMYDADGNEIQYTVKEAAVEDYTTSIDTDGSISTIINTHEDEKTSVEVTKVWEDENNRDGVRPTSIQVELLLNGNATGKFVTLTNGKLTDSFTNLDVYTPNVEGGTIKNVYTVREVTSEDNAENMAKYTSNITYSDNNTKATITNTHTVETVSLSVNKVWSDANDQDGIRPNLVKVQLYAGDAKEGAEVELNENNRWSASWNNLKKNANGNAIVYSVKEAEVEGYTSNADDKLEFGENTSLTITNTHEVAKTSVKVKKEWSDDNNNDGIRPSSVTINLLADGDKVDSVVLDKDNEWKHEFANLDKFKAGKEIKYTVSEETVNGYTPDVTGTNNDYTVTNSHNIDRLSYTVEKVWDDSDNNDGIRPDSVQVQLYAKVNDTVKAEGAAVTLTENENGKWTYTWTNLPVKKDGVVIDYSVKELEVDSRYEDTYAEVGNKTTITNTHNNIQQPITIKKEWVGDEAVAANRPASITVKLYKLNQDGSKKHVQDVELTKANNWVTSIALDKYENGQVIDYIIQEADTGSGYDVTYDKTVNETDNTIVLKAINTYNVVTGTFTVTKAWSDANNQDGKRPNEVTVQLLKNGTLYDTQTLNVANGMTYTWTNLEYERDHQENTYSVEELRVNNYQTSIGTVTGTDTAKSVVITNTHTPATTSFEVEKVWEDDDNNDRVRPSSISVQLLANGVEYGDPVTITPDANNNWTATWDGLAVYANGQPITYTVEEADVEGYVDSTRYVKVNDTDLKEYKAIITNNHGNATTSFTATKEWNDNDDNDRIRPTSVQVQLYADGSPVADQVATLDKDNNWTVTWTGLQAINKGTPIVYTVNEVNVPTGYEAEVVDTENGQKIVNTHTNDPVTINVTKQWIDQPADKDNDTESINVNLYADGTKVDTLVLDRENDWTTSVTRDKFVNGNEINYEVKEATKVSGYDASYEVSKSEDGNTINLTVKNTYNVVTGTFTVNKKWVDGHNQDGIRPNDIAVQLVKNGENYLAPVTLTVAEEMTYTWSGLEYERDGVTNTYTVREVEVPTGYQSVVGEVTGADTAKSVVVTNTHIPSRTSFSVEKVWVDNNNQDGMRPDSVTIRFFRDGEEIATSERRLTKGNWTAYLGTMLDYSNGKKQTYTVEEDPVEGYVATYEYDEKTGKFTVTNTHTTKKVSPTVKFVWDDVNNAEGIRPESMQVTIKGTITKEVDGEEVTEVVVNEPITVNNSTWTGGWTDLPEYSNGKKITYTVEQGGIPGKYTYIGTDTTSLEATFVITNKYVPTVDKKITVIWDDNNDNNKKRPTEVEIQPSVDGKPVGEPIKVTVENNKDEEDDNKWSTTVTLPKYNEEGKEIEYKVSQNEVPKYDTTYSEDTLTITNKYIPDPVIIVPSNPPLEPSKEPTEEPTVEPTEEPTVEPSEEPTDEPTVKPTVKPNEPTDSDDDANKNVVKPTAPNKYLQAPVSSDNNSTDAQKGNDNTPKTSDDNNMLLYCLYMLLSATGIMVLLSKKRKNIA